MALVSPKAYIDGEIVDSGKATISVMSSAAMYGLSVYSVFFLKVKGVHNLAFRLKDHYQRLVNSSRLIGLDEFSHSYQEFEEIMKNLVSANRPTEDQFVRVTLHATQQVAGVRTSGLQSDLSVFMYQAENILPQDGAKLKTSLWRRTADTAIPARAKVNGAYVNSCLAKQEAISNGYDDCVFLNKDGFVSELSAANIFIVKDGALVTPDVSSDILEGITRRSVIQLARESGVDVVERKVALTELYTADEIFACGTSAFVSPVMAVDDRVVCAGEKGEVTNKLRDRLASIQKDESHNWVTTL